MANPKPCPALLEKEAEGRERGVGEPVRKLGPGHASSLMRKAKTAFECFACIHAGDIKRLGLFGGEPQDCGAHDLESP